MRVGFLALFAAPLALDLAEFVHACPSRNDDRPRDGADVGDLRRLDARGPRRYTGSFPSLPESRPVTLADTAVLVACLLPIVCAGLAKYKGFGTPRHLGGFDNHDPRRWLSTLEGWQARAHAAQQNSFEALPLFIAGVLIAERLHPALQSRIDGLAMLFIAARIGYIAAYVTDRAALRTVLWTVGIGACIGLFFVG